MGRRFRNWCLPPNICKRAIRPGGTYLSSNRMVTHPTRLTTHSWGWNWAHSIVCNRRNKVLAKCFLVLSSSENWAIFLVKRTFLGGNATLGDNHITRHSNMYFPQIEYIDFFYNQKVNGLQKLVLLHIILFERIFCTRKINIFHY